MTKKRLISNKTSIADSAESLPEVSFSKNSRAPGNTAMPRPLRNINDTGRIKFGAAARIPEQK